MGFLDFLGLGNSAGKAIAEPVEAIGNVFDKLFTSDEEKAQAAFVLEKLRQKPHMLQGEINKIEASHRSIFVAGWRPSIGWICSAGLFCHFVFFPLLTWVTALLGKPIPTPHIESGELMTLVLSILGLGGLRTLEKGKSISK